MAAKVVKKTDNAKAHSFFCNMMRRIQSERLTGQERSAGRSLKQLYLKQQQVFTAG